MYIFVLEIWFVERYDKRTDSQIVSRHHKIDHDSHFVETTQKQIHKTNTFCWQIQKWFTLCWDGSHCVETYHKELVHIFADISKTDSHFLVTSQNLFTFSWDIIKTYSHFLETFQKLVHIFLRHHKNWFPFSWDIAKTDSHFLKTSQKLIHILTR